MSITNTEMDGAAAAAVGNARTAKNAMDASTAAAVLNATAAQTARALKIAATLKAVSVNVTKKKRTQRKEI